MYLKIMLLNAFRLVKPKNFAVNMAAETRTCRKLLLTGFGGYDKLKVAEEAMPKAEANEVSSNKLLSHQL